MTFQGTYDNSFRPQINKHSQHLHIAPLQDRMRQVMQEQHLKKAQLLDEAEGDFQAKATFAPAIDRVSEKLCANRVPLSERTNFPKDYAPLVDPEATHAPKINATSKKLLGSSAAREAQAVAGDAKRKVKELWTRHCQGGGQMIWPEVSKCLKDIKIDPEGDIGKKFYLALGFDGPHANKYIEFPRFSSIFTSVIQSAAAASAASAASNGNSSHNDSGTPSSQVKTAPAAQVHRAAPQLSNDEMDDDDIEIYADLEVPQPHMQPPTQPVRQTARQVDRQQPKTTNSVPRSSSTAANQGPQPLATAASSYYARSASASQQPTHVDPMQPATTSSKQSAAARPQQGSTTTIDAKTTSTPTQSTSHQVATSPAASRNRLTTVIPKRQVASKYAQRTEAAKAAPLSQEEQDLAACTFDPKINRHIAKGIRTTGAAKKKEPIQSTADAEAAKCSFQPRTNPSHSTTYMKHHRGQHQQLQQQEGRLSAPVVSAGEAEEDPYAAILSPPKRRGQSQPAATSSSSSSAGVSPGSGEQLLLGSNSYLKNCPGFDKSIQRMAAARDLHKPRFEESLRGEGGSSPQHHHQPHAELDKTKVQPFHLRSEKRLQEREKEKPMLYVDVDVAAGKHGRIGVHRGDRPEELARNFARTYGIDYGIEQKLGDMLREKIRHTLEKESVRTLEV